MKHIVILTGQHMTANPRVWKEANALIELGYKVTVLTTWYDETNYSKDLNLLSPGVIYKAAINLIKFKGPLADRIISGIIREIARQLKLIFDIDSTLLLTNLPWKQKRKALAENADLYIAHQESGLVTGTALLKEGIKVAFDFEDWYSRDFINESRPIELLSRLESVACRHAQYISCPSKSMADGLSVTYRPLNPIHIIYNGFSFQEAQGITQKSKIERSLVWFSQTIGPKRGLENCILAINQLSEKVSLHILGRLIPGYDRVLQSKLNKNHSIHFYHPIDHSELVPFLTRFQVGLALELTYPASRNTTISNKILQYIQAGLYVLATSTEGQIELQKSFIDSIRLVKEDSPVSWVNDIEYLLAKNDFGAENSSTTFRTLFSWEAQSQKLATLVSEAISSVN